MTDFNIKGEDKLLNYERLSPTFAVYQPLQQDLSKDNLQSNISIPTYTPQNYSATLPKPNYVDAVIETKDPSSEVEATKSAVELMKEAAARVIKKKPLYQTSSGFSNKPLKDQIAAIESDGGNYKAYNSKGGGEGAVGKYQFRWTTWKPDIKKVTGISTKEEFMNNPEAQEQYFDHFERTVLRPQARQLKRQFPDTTYDDTQLAKLVHFQGLQGARNFLAGGSDKPQSFNVPISTYLKKPQ